MPRGAKLDRATTELLHRIGLLQDKRSFVSLQGHAFLKGQDVCAARARAITRASTGDPDDFVSCQAPGCTLAMAPYQMELAEMHHLDNRPSFRCDCDHNLAMWCRYCHRKRHNQ